jgi:hypothetical protein
MRRARSCYDHLAGDLAVKMFDRFVATGLLVQRGEILCVTPEGRRWFTERGIDIDGLAHGRRELCRCCLDWSERSYHLGGALGAAVFAEILARGWAVREARTRIVRFSAFGERKLTAWFRAGESPQGARALRATA